MVNGKECEHLEPRSRFVRIHIWAVPVSLSVTFLVSYHVSFTNNFPRFNEGLRHDERRLQFNVDALAKAVCHSASRPVNSLASISKLAEGDFNCVLQATFDDGYAVIARLPYTTTVPKSYAVASEVATLDLLRSRGIPVPKVLAYSSQ